MNKRHIGALVAVLALLPATASADIWFKGQAMKIVIFPGGCKIQSQRENGNTVFSCDQNKGSVAFGPWEKHYNPAGEWAKYGCNVSWWQSGIVGQTWHADVKPLAKGPPHCWLHWDNGNTATITWSP